MKLFLASATLHLRQLKVSSVNDRIANGALLYAGEFLVHVASPDLQALVDRAVLMSQVRGQLKQPVSPLVLANPEPLHTPHLYHSKWVICRQLYDKFHAQFFYSVSRDDFSCAKHSTNFNCRLLIVIIDFLCFQEAFSGLYSISY